MPTAHYDDDVTIQVPILKAELQQLRKHIDYRFDALQDALSFGQGLSAVALAVSMVAISVAVLAFVLPLLK